MTGWFIFGFSGDRRMFRHIGIVSDRCFVGLPHWHRKAGILPLHSMRLTGYVWFGLKNQAIRKFETFY
jgi:hypothetical protein